MIGEVIGNYRLVSELGKGGMGMVYRAEHVQLGRPAALKMLLPQLSSDAGMVHRFFNEARAASAIDHPGIVEVYDFGVHTDGSAYIVMALLRGENLAQRLERGPLGPDASATIIAQAAAALAAAHARGIIHRDLKPDNIFLVPNDLMPGGIQVKLLDFGIAKLSDDQDTGLKTKTGMLMGTPAYMSPEQCMGRTDLDHRTDIYSIGCILFHLLCERTPFTSDQGTGMIIAAHIRDAAPDPRSLRPHVPAALAAIVLRCLEKDPDARFQSATELRNALVGAGASAPLSRPPGSEQYAATLAGPSLASAYPSAVPGGYPSAPPSSAATTRGGSAGQMIATVPDAGAPRRSRGLLIGGLVVVLAGAGVAVAMTRGHDASPGVGSSTASGDRAGSTAPPTERAAGSAAPTERAAGSGAPPTERAAAGSGTPAGHTGSDAAAGSGSSVIAAPETPCAPGQTRRDDTQGHCCWPGQAWSTSTDRCVGAPACPEGMIARGDQCAPNEVATRRRLPRKLPDPQGASGNVTAAPTFHLDARAYAPEAAIEIRFAGPVHSTPQSRSWITVIEAGRPASAYGEWSYLDDGVTVSTLKAPSKPGAYEVRLHTDYPARTFNVAHAVPFSVGPERNDRNERTEPDQAAAGGPTPLSAQRFHVAAATVHAGAKIDVRFATALHAATGERFWITVVKADEPSSAWGSYEYVPDGARRMQLTAPTAPGDYEVRLHGNYPTKTTNMVHRVAVHVAE